jgi:hypothetical protein
VEALSEHAPAEEDAVGLDKQLGLRWQAKKRRTPRMPRTTPISTWLQAATEDQGTAAQDSKPRASADEDKSQKKLRYIS